MGARKLATALFVAIVLVSAVSFSSAQGWATAPAPRPPLDHLLRELDDSQIEDEIVVATEIWERRGELTQADLINTIRDESYPRQARELAIDIATERSTRLDPELRALVSEPSLSPDLRSRLVSRARFTKADAGVLDQLSRSTDGSLAFHAMKQLAEVDAPMATSRALSILRNAQGTEQISAAYKTLSRLPNSQRIAGTQRVLIEHILAVACKKDSPTDLTDAGIVALVDLRSLESMDALLDCPVADQIMLGGAVDENAWILLDALEDSPTASVVALTIRAMEIRPIAELAEPLERAAATLTDPGLRNKADAVAKRAREFGSPLNTKSRES
jgi:hypothetical protein